MGMEIVVSGSNIEITSKYTSVESMTDNITGENSQVNAIVKKVPYTERHYCPKCSDCRWKDFDCSNRSLRDPRYKLTCDEY